MMSPNRREPVPLTALWFALLGGPLAWSAHLLGSYPLVPLACRTGSTAPLIILTLCTAAIALAAAGTGWWAYRRAPGGEDTGRSRPAFMALAGLLLALLFTFAVVLEGLPALLQDPCSQGL